MFIDEEHRLNLVTQQLNRFFVVSRAKTSEAAFETVAMPYLKDLYSTAFRLLLDVRKASKAVQETYRSCCKEFDGSERLNYRVWMFQTLFESVRRERHLTDVASVSAVPVGDKKILNAMDWMAHELREVLLLVDVQGFSYPETSTILDIDVETVKSRIGRARTMLYHQLS
jgi:DNA-directed RNA polymerase specialized sigma24 family protein